LDLQVLDQMEMISAFTDVLHVPNLTTDAQMMNVLKQSDAFSRDDLAKLASKLKGRKASIGEGVFFRERNSSVKISEFGCVFCLHARPSFYAA
jgi:hypothetical protein